MKFPFKFKHPASESLPSPTPLRLEGSETVDWLNLEHAYGSAEDIPDQLLALASRDKEAGGKAINSFYGNIYHQGTTYQATSYAVPFLQQILADEQNPLRAEILMLLVHLAFGTSYHEVHQSFFSFENERDRPEFQGKIQRELDDVEKARLAVEQGVSQYTELLNDGSADIRARAVYLASLFSRQKPEVTAVFWDKLEAETDELVRASLWLGFAFKPFNEEEPQKFEAAFQRTDSSLEKWALAALILKIEGSAFRENAAQFMVESLSASQELVESYGQLPACNEGIVADSAGQLLRLGTEARKFSAALCDQIRLSKNQFGALYLLGSIAPLFFGDFSAEDPVKWESLDETQREVLKTMTEADGIWGDGKFNLGNLSSLLRYYGLPDDRAKMRALVETSTSNF